MIIFFKKKQGEFEFKMTITRTVLIIIAAALGMI